MEAQKPDQSNKDIVFHINNKQYKTIDPTHSVRELLVNFAGETLTSTIVLAKRKGNELERYQDLDQVITLENGMHFVVLHDGPTTVS